MKVLNFDNAHNIVPKILVLTFIMINKVNWPHTQVSDFDLGNQNETFIMIPKENWSHHQSMQIWPLNDRWPQNGDLQHDPQVKTDPITQVWKFNLWMTFDPKMVNENRNDKSVSNSIIWHSVK